MTTGAFDPRLRSVECGQCGQGTPLTVSFEGGLASCRTCGHTVELLPRDDRPPGTTASSPSDEIARQTRLFLQLRHPIPGHPYDLSVPPPGFTADPERDKGSGDALRSAWNAARKSLPTASVAKQRDALWIALHLVDVQLAEGNPHGARALLETALDTIADSGLQHLLRCRLSALSLWDDAPEAAEYWLAGCDPAPEVVQLDATYREAQARLAARAGRPEEVLGWVGSAHGSVAVPPAWERAFDTLRIAALGALPGAADGDRAFAELSRAIALHGDGPVFSDLGPADPSVRRFQREAMGRLAESRDAIPTGATAVFAELARLPLLALGVMVLVTLPRMFFDADPFGGAHGYALCPLVCADCTGPFRVHTEWHHHEGSHSTNGSDYYCATPTNEIFSLSDAEISRERPQLRPYKLAWAPGALTYASLLLLLTPVSALTGLREHFLNRRRRERLLPELERLAEAAGTTPPAPQNAPARPAVVSFATRVSLALLGSAILVAAELWLHKQGS
jgi:hypothetical protein